jgi:hypothetical protein
LRKNQASLDYTMDFKRRWRAYLVGGALVLIALVQFAVVGAGAAGWFNHQTTIVANGFRHVTSNVNETRA